MESHTFSHHIFPSVFWPNSCAMFSRSSSKAFGYIRNDPGDVCFPTAGDIEVTLTVTDADGVGFKRAAQAVANALGGGHRAGQYVKIADTSTGKFIHRDILAVASVA